MESRKRREVIYAFKKTLPILFSYLFLSMAFGIMMNQAGLSFVWAYMISATIYTGAFQFVIVPFLSDGVKIITVVLTALAMNSRHIFYGFTFIEEFKKMGNKYLYMIFSLTDETYSLDCSLDVPNDFNRENIMFYIALFSRIYWLIGTSIGAFLGKIIPFDFEGIDFCMTALFITIFVDQWRQTRNHIPSIIGAISSIVFMIVFGKDSFILPALMTSTALLIICRKQIDEGSNTYE